VFRTFARKFLPNPLDWKLKWARRRKAEKVLLCWNRGLGDIPLGVAAIIHRIREYLPEAKITVLTRENLRDGFALLPGIEVLVDPTWKRGSQCKAALHGFDLVIQKPSPSEWCRWQWKSFTPRLKWTATHERPFDLPEGFTYIGVQAVAETNYGLWRNWPIERWHQLFAMLEKRPNVRILLFGFGDEPKFSHPNVIDLRGKTSLYELLSIIKNRCTAVILPDSGILAMTYYLDVAFPIRVISLFADPHHGILKQGVPSPNPLLRHTSLVGADRDLSTISAQQVEAVLFPQALTHCPHANSVSPKLIAGAAAVILAGGMGSRLGFAGPKGLYVVEGKTLFQHLLEKIPPGMPVAVMTSPLNHAETVAYFERNGYKAYFFQQPLIALLDESYRPVGEGPDGNGSIYASLVKSGILEQWSEIDTLLISPIENPLADPADAKLLTYHREKGADVTVKCTERKRGESMGALTERGIVEYFDILDDNYAYSYVGQVALATRFVREAANRELPYHWVRKKGLWKREKLLFDAFSRIEALCYDRQVCYAPVKGRI
jgi:ADP-heptose:LPS heptosyltransferase